MVQGLSEEIKVLSQQKEALILKRDKLQEDIENSEEYKKLNEEHNSIKEQRNKISIRVREIEEEIRYDFLDDGIYPSWGSTYGKNISSEVIKAIKETFDFKRLSQSTIESIVSSMIRQKEHDNSEIKSLERKDRDLDYKIDEVRKKMYSLTYEATKDIQKEIMNLSEKIREKEKEIVSSKLDNSKDIKSKDLNNPYLKKQALEEYRRECERNFDKVFEKLKLEEKA